MCKPRSLLNLIFILTLVMAALGNNATEVRAENGNDGFKADPRLLQMAEENPDAIFMVIVQKDAKNKDLKDMEVEDEVLKGSGQVKKQLDLIVSFSAEMSGREITKLARHPGVRWISADAPMVSTAAGDPTLRDEFAAAAYSNNNGTQSWGSNWIETGDGSVSATFGYVKISGGQLQLSSTNRTLTRQGTLPGVASATLSFQYKRSGLDGASDYVAIQASANGGTTWTELARYAGAGSDSAWQTASFNILNYAAANTQIRFATSSSLGTSDILYIDNLQIEYALTVPTSTPAPTPPPTPQLDLTTGLQGHWDFDANANDFSGNARHGTLTNGAVINTTAATNRVGAGKVSLDGSNDYVNLSGQVSGFQSLAQGTISAWVYPDGSTTGILFEASDSGDSNSRLALIRQGDGSLQFFVREGTTTRLDVDTFAGTVPQGTWSHVAVTVDTSGNKLFVNGTQVANGSLTYAKGSSATSSFFDDVTNLDFMAWGVHKYTGDNASYADAFDGFIDNGSLYNRALLPAEIAQLFGIVVPSAFTSATRADQLSSTLTGQGVTVAVIDSGVASFHPDLNTGGISRVIASEKFGFNLTTEDLYGHGTHVAGIIGGNGTASGGTYKGMAPDVNLINLKVSNELGMTYESAVVESLQWVYNNKSAYNIRVVNISMNSTVAQSYHTSPLTAAVEILWLNGIVVVVSVGNNGTIDGPSTIYPPANDPFVITVGASEDKGTASLSDDTMAVFSAYGTTEDGFAKPDLVAPGRNVIAPLGGLFNIIFATHPLHRVNDYYFRMSGTSMSAPMVSGAVALLLEDEPNLTPDQVKYRLTASANKSWANYDSSKTGAGYLDIYAAVYSTTTQSANTGIVVSNMLTTGSNPVTWGSVGWNSVGWNSVGWNSVGWNSVGWNSVGWNSVGWNASLWDN